MRHADYMTAALLLLCAGQARLCLNVSKLSLQQAG